ncbi:hypothetical protein [Cellvibrio sp. QJXJ]|uniref:hypothetical protein n=1 Tax=Cellvibrio sp. QJXJ TaxID=2964606 RepID=UPI0021C4BB22|nr:hypothetical protein [Cellvibrio sp. QJXJ]UUA73555.1 hypothetical protein NNX04_03690 [Cellvibrio sp. QJXJ]
MFGAFMGAAGGGGMSASSSASASQETANNISSGGINVGGLTMGNKSFFETDVAKVAAVGGVLVIGLFLLRKK